MNNINRDREVINIINDNNDINKSINNEELLINYYNNNQDNININIDVDSNSILNINMSSIINNNIKINIFVNVTGDNNIVNIYYRGISQQESALVEVNIKVNENTTNNQVKEDLKGLNEDGTISLIPILEIESFEVNAEHYATIGQIDSDKLFYLMQKGITRDNAYNILKELYIFSLFDNDFIKLIKKGV